MKERLIIAILEMLPKLNVESLNYINGVANGVVLASQGGGGNVKAAEHSSK